MSLIMRKPAFCLCENKDADQLCSNCTADQCLCFCSRASTISLLSKYEISSFRLFMAVQADLIGNHIASFLLTWAEHMYLYMKSLWTFLVIVIPCFMGIVEKTY